MKLLMLDGRTINVNVDQSRFPLRGEKSRSKLQNDVGIALFNRFSFHTILEEFPVAGTQLSIDFFIPGVMIAIEADGEQHRKFSKFFHGTIQNFKKQQERDARKQKWCDMNDITLIRCSSADDLLEKIR